MKLTKDRIISLGDLEENLGVKFKNITILNEALTHSSYANEHKGNIVYNERLEFLGDAVLELASSTIIYNKFPQMSEGKMSKLRASIVCEESLSKLAKKLELGKYMLFGYGEEVNGGRKRPSILADAFESVIAAIYLDQGWEIAFDYVKNQLSDAFSNVKDEEFWKDYKSKLQELAQDMGKSVVYELISASGPAHNPIYEIQVRVDDIGYGIGKGHSKKSAEQDAAHKTFLILEKRHLDF